MEEEASQAQNSGVQEARSQGALLWQPIPMPTPHIHIIVDEMHQLDYLNATKCIDEMHQF